MITGEQVYLPAFYSGQKRLTLIGSEFHHLIRVRRFQIDTEIWVVNGQGLAALAMIDTIDNESLELDILREEPRRGELHQEIILAIANLKGDHLNLVVEKATELGICQIVPLLTDHTIKKGLNQKRLERIAIAAMKQSRRSFLPQVHELIPFRKMLEKYPTACHLFCYAGDNSVNILANKTQITAAEQVIIWIGPEGDWSKDEIDLASVSDYTFTGLGPRRLRAETAAIHGVGLVSALLQDPA